MKNLLDIVNFNADASCLDSKIWLQVISGGENSLFCQWLKLYINSEQKIILGLTGATIADLIYYNNEAIKLINTNPKIFEIIIRSFSHDISLLRSKNGFKENLLKGYKIIKNEFNNVALYYLPTEFMLTNEQVSILCDFGIRGVFVNSKRFNIESANKIPKVPYLISGIFDKKITCYPVFGKLTDDYLNSLHLWNNDDWNNNIINSKTNNIFSWRDGESWIFVPNGIEREKTWIKKRDKNIQHIFLKDLDKNKKNDTLHITKQTKTNYYPIHPFTAWLRELRMLGFIHRIQILEDKLERLSKEEIILWLQVINSDILSSIEKSSPIIKIKNSDTSHKITEWVIPRSKRGVEGEEFLSLLENLNLDINLNNYLNQNSSHILKLRARIKYFKNEN